MKPATRIIPMLSVADMAAALLRVNRNRRATPVKEIQVA